MATEAGQSEKFFGMTKLSFLIAIICVLTATTLSSLGALAVAARTSLVRADAAQQEVVVAKKLAVDIKQAVCGMKNNAREQIRATTTFLIEHPGAEPIPGITRKSITDGLARQRAFLDTMQSLDCD